jgi:hypothetical protein
MKVVKNKLVALALMIGMSMLPVFAQGYRANNKQIRTLINQIEVKSNNFKYQLNRGVDLGTVNNSPRENNISRAVSSFERSVDLMKQNFFSHREISHDVREVLRSAAQIEGVLHDYRLNPQTENSWRLLKTDLNTLGRLYNISADWNYPNYPAANYLNGTYRLNINQSDNLDAAIDQALSGANYNQRERLRNNLRRRLSVPDYLAIEKVNNVVKMASSNAAQTTFETNGRATTEYLSNGRTMTTTVSLSGNKLIINSDGDRVNAFYIAFESAGNGQKLKVTRRLYLENREQTISVVSIYDKTANVAQWNIFRNREYSAASYANDDYARSRFYVRNGTQLTAVLNSELSTKGHIEGQKFAMTVTSPSAYYGAIIKGTVSRAARSGRLTGKAELSLNFETITLRSGQTYRFQGLIDSVRTANGKTIMIDKENAVKSGSQTTDTVVRSGVGAAIGAIIGGLTGGEKGAAIGAVIGAGAGSGSVLLEGRENLELAGGTTFNLTAGSNIR